MVKIMYWGLCDKCGGALIKTQKGILCENCDMEDEQTMRVISRTKDQPTEQEEQDNEFTQ